MCPIKGVSDARRVPRLGKIRLGIMVETPGKNPRPHATDYFVVPDEIKPIVGNEPKQLNIMFPSDNIEVVAPQWLRCYGQTHGLVCWGDGETAQRKFDMESGEMAGRNTSEWEWRPWTCNPAECEEFGARCKKVMNLMFLMPEVKGLGVWQIDTSSFYSIREINSTFDLIRELTRRPGLPEGRIAFIPLILVLGPVQVNPQGTAKKTVHIIHLNTDMVLAELTTSVTQRLGPGKMGIAEPDVEEAPDDLYDHGVLEGEAPHWEEEPSAVETPLESQDERLQEWQKIKALMPELKFSSKTARSYFAQVHDVSVPLAALDEPTPPAQVTLPMLSSFRERLEQSRMNLV